MRQRITVTATVPHSGYTLTIHSVHQVNQEIIVVAELTVHGGFVIPDDMQLEETVNVKTSANQLLPVSYYLTNVKPEKIASGEHPGNYHSTWLESRKPSTTFVAIEATAEIQETLNHGRCLYRPRSDNLKAVRLGQIEQQSQSILTDLPRTPVPMVASILNIYPCIVDGEFKVTFETIAHDGISIYNLHELVNIAARACGTPALDLAKDFSMRIDDHLYFGNYVTTAIEFTLALNNVPAFLRFLRFTEELLKEAASDKKSYIKPFQRLQVSGGSVLAGFSDIFISHGTRKRQSDDCLVIEYPEQLNINEFLNHSVQLEKLDAARLIVAAYVKADLPGYDAHIVRDILAEGVEVCYFPHLVLNKLLQEDIMALRQDTDIASRLAQVARIQQKLMSPGMLDRVGPFLHYLQNSLVTHLMMQAVDKLAFDGHKYSAGYTEFSFLAGATFRMRPDGRLSLTHEDNPGYRQFYALGRQNYDIFALEMQHLAKVIGPDLEFDDECQFHEEIIFTAACSQRLQALGALLNERNLREQLLLRQPTETVVVVPVMLSNTESAPVQDLQSLLSGRVITSFIAKYPAMQTIIDLLLVNKLFTDDILKNKLMLANLINACESLVTAKASQQPSVDSIASLVALHQMLADCHLLTVDTHCAITTTLRHDAQLEATLQIIRLVGTLTPALSEKIFLSGGYLSLIRDFTHEFDASDESFLYLLDKVPAANHFSYLWDSFAMLHMNLGASKVRGLSFLTKADFKLFVDKTYPVSLGGYSILAGLKSLAEVDLLNQFHDQFIDCERHHLTHKQLYTAFDELHMARMMNATTVTLLLDGLDLKTVMNLGRLQLAGILDECRDLVIAHPECHAALVKLHKDGMLTSDNLHRVVAFPEYLLLDDLCDKLAITRDYRNTYKPEEVTLIRQAILQRQEFRDALLYLHHVINNDIKSRQIDYSNSDLCRKYQHDVITLIKCAGILPNNRNPNNVLTNLLAYGLALFAAPIKSLQEYAEELKEKYPSPTFENRYI